MDLVRPQVACRREEPNAIYLHFYRGHVALAGTSFAATINVPGDHAHHFKAAISASV